MNFLRNKIFIILDVSLVLTAVLMVTTDFLIFLFHLMFLLLTIGAFYWNLRGFVVRSAVWVSVTVAVLVTSITIGETHSDELHEIPLLVALLCGVFFISRRRMRAENELRAINEELETRVAARTAELTSLNVDLTREITQRREIEHALRLAVAKNQAMLDAISDSIFQVHRTGRIVDYKIQENNPPVWAQPVAEGKETLQEIFPPELAAVGLNYVAMALKSETNQMFEYQLLVAKTEYDLEVRVVPVGEDEALLLLADVTAYKTAQAAMEKERARIGRDLHDSLGQSLGYLRLKLDQYSMKDYSVDNDQLRQELLAMRDVTNEAYEIVRSMLAAARPSNSMALQTMLLAQAQTVGSRARFKVFLRSQGEPRPLPPIVQQQVLFICQEALSNIEKHAAAETVDILLDWHHDGLTISLIDDGRGFSTDMPVEHGHFGLMIMQERASEIEGRLSIASTPGGGTTIMIHLPDTSITAPVPH